MTEPHFATPKKRKTPPKNAQVYHYGFNGKEKTDEMFGEGDAYDYGMRGYDARAGRFWSVDPLARQYPFLSPYQFSANTPIAAKDIDGAESNVTFSFNPTTLYHAIFSKSTLREILNIGEVKIGATMTGGAIGAVTPTGNIEFSKFNKFIIPQKAIFGTSSYLVIPTNSQIVYSKSNSYSPAKYTPNLNIEASDGGIFWDKPSGEGTTDAPDQKAIVKPEGAPAFLVSTLPKFEYKEGQGGYSPAPSAPLLAVPSFYDMLKSTYGKSNYGTIFPKPEFKNKAKVKKYARPTAKDSY